MAELSGKSLQQDLFVKKLWFHALNTRGKQRERELQEAGVAESSKVEDLARWGDNVAEDGSASNIANDTSQHIFDSPSNGTRVSSPEWKPIATSFADNGVVLLKGSTNAFEVRNEKLACAAGFVQDRLRVLRAVAADAGAGAEDHRLKTAELVRRSPGRYDLVVPTHDPSDDCAAPILALLEGAPWLPFVRHVLGNSARLIHAGCVCSLPGSAVQGIHRDGKHLFSSSESGGSALPTHCLTVFLPLVPLTSAIGPTQFWPGTHAEFGDAPHANARSVTFAASPEISGIESQRVAVPGDAIIFDYRILHRGLPNDSEQARPLAYFTFAKPWFSDVTNYTNTSLFGEEADQPLNQNRAESASVSIKNADTAALKSRSMAEEAEDSKTCPPPAFSAAEDVDD
jgi:hypothetical protein